MKKRQGGFHIYLTNRVAYTLMAVLILAIVGVGVYAFGTTSPTTFGHSLGEIAPPANCAGSKNILHWTGSVWDCVAASASYPSITDVSGRVGIGTTSPGAILHVSKTKSNGAFLARFGGFGDFNVDAQDVIGGRLTIKDGTGNVGIGTASPEQRLHVEGASEILSTGPGAGFKFRDRGSPASGSYDWVWYSEGNVARLWAEPGSSFGSGGGDRLTIYRNGNVRVSGLLNVNGGQNTIFRISDSGCGSPQSSVLTLADTCQTNPGCGGFDNKYFRCGGGDCLLNPDTCRNQDTGLRVS